jgi:hypothetical protein
LDPPSKLADMPLRTITYRGTKILLTDEMFGYLEYAMKSPNRLHKFGPDEDGIAAVKKLEKAGLVEIREYSGHYKINPTF